MQEDKIKRNRLGHHNYKPNQFTEINQVGFTVDTKKKMVIPKNTAAQIIVKTKLRAETVFFQSKDNSYFLNSNNLLPHNGIFKIEHNTFIVTILNMGDKDVVLGKNAGIGKIYPGSQSSMSGVRAESGPQTRTGLI